MLGMERIEDGCVFMIAAAEVATPLGPEGGRNFGLTVPRIKSAVVYTHGFHNTSPNQHSGREKIERKCHLYDLERLQSMQDSQCLSVST